MIYLFLFSQLLLSKESSPPRLSWVRLDRCLSFWPFFLLVIAMSVRLRCMASDCPFSTFKLFLSKSLIDQVLLLTLSSSSNPTVTYCHLCTASAYLVLCLVSGYLDKRTNLTCQHHLRFQSSFHQFLNLKSEISFLQYKSFISLEHLNFNFNY